MKTDQLFSELFQLAPQALFELFGIEPGCTYQFDSPVLKASERRLDGLLKPAEARCPYYFLEIQGYLDYVIYWRTLHEVSLFHEQRPELRGQDWRAIILFLDKAFDPGLETLGPLYQKEMPWLIVGVLPDLLAQLPQSSPILNVLRPLVATDEVQVRKEAAGWSQAIRQESELDTAGKERLLNLLIQFIGQRFVDMSNKEIQAMLKLIPFEETAAGRGYIEEGIQRGTQQTLKETVIQALAVRFDDVPESIAEVVDQIEDAAALRTLFKQAVIVDSLETFEKQILAAYK